MAKPTGLPPQEEGQVFCSQEGSMNEVVRRHRHALALCAYLAAALILAACPLALPIAHRTLPYVFAVETVVLAGAGLWLWRTGNAAVSAMAFRDELTALANRRA